MPGRNNKIIDVVLKKIHACCPNSVDLIGIAGSFAYEQFDNRSDLDLCIISNDEKANDINKCFILNNIGFDIYYTPWWKMEKMSKYDSPFVAKLLNLKIVYTSNKNAEEKYLQLRKNLLENISNTEIKQNNAKSFIDNSFSSFAKLIISDEIEDCWFNFYQMATAIEAGLFIINGDYLKRGIKHVHEELAKLEKLPINFIGTFNTVLNSKNIEDIKSNATKLAKSLADFLSINYPDKIETLSEMQITGSYEEIVSNWKSKIERSIDDNDIYAQFMALASCQNFYNEMGLRNINVLKNFSATKLVENQNEFTQGLKKLEELYKEKGIKISKYNSIEEFENDYLNN